jgi:hypothetical protein
VPHADWLSGGEGPCNVPGSNVCKVPGSNVCIRSTFVKFRGTRENPIAKAHRQSTTEYSGTTSNRGMVNDDIDVHSYVLYLSEFNALICRTCQHGLTRDGVARHFQRHHKSISNGIRKQLSSFASGLTVSNIDEIIFPSIEIDAIDGLLYGLVGVRVRLRTRHVTSTVRTDPQSIRPYTLEGWGVKVYVYIVGVYFCWRYGQSIRAYTLGI